MAKSRSMRTDRALAHKASTQDGAPRRIDVRRELEKTPTGISGFDEITFGGVPKGRPTLVIGGAGSGKTLFGMQFLVRGAVDHGEAGVFLTFEETADDLTKNVRSLGYDLRQLASQNLIAIEHAALDQPSRVIGQGEYDLDALFMRLARTIDTLGATRVVVDTLEVIITDDRDRAAVRTTCLRLFRWLKNRGVTSIITAEESNHGRTAHDLEEFIADCVVHLDHRVDNQVSSRTLRVVKYRGSKHGTNEYPFLIGDEGISVLPVTSIGLRHRVSDERVSSGIPRLDTMLGGKGFYRGSTVMISGTPGSGKSSVSAEFTNAACARGERVIYFTFEESPEQVTRNMRSIGLDLQRWVDSNHLRFVAARPSAYGLEMHLAVMMKVIRDFDAQNVVVDPISNIIRAGSTNEAHTMVVRLVDFLKTRGATAILTHPTAPVALLDHSELAISSIIDTWILLQSVESGGERNRTLLVLKSRGMYHSNQLREFLITDNAIELVDVYTGPDGVLTGASRATKEAEQRAAQVAREHETRRAQHRFERRRQAIEAQIAALRAELESDESEMLRGVDEANAAESERSQGRQRMARIRGADKT
jgi:circadian clock protein KaiC